VYELIQEYIYIQLPEEEKKHRKAKLCAKLLAIYVKSR
jgi:hypothetical protein